MKKLSLLILLSAFIFSGCGYYTCPTYAEVPQQNEEQQNSFKESVARP